MKTRCPQGREGVLVLVVWPAWLRRGAVTSVSLSFGCLRRRLKLASDRYPLPSSTVRPHTPALAEDPSIGFRDVLRLGTSESHQRRHRLHISSNRLYFTHPFAMLEVSYPCRDSHWHAPAPSIPHRLYSTTRAQVRVNRRWTTALMKMTSNTRVKPELSSFSPEWTNKQTNE